MQSFYFNTMKTKNNHSHFYHRQQIKLVFFYLFISYSIITFTFLLWLDVPPDYFYWSTKIAPVLSFIILYGFAHLKKISMLHALNWFLGIVEITLAVELFREILSPTLDSHFIHLENILLSLFLLFLPVLAYLPKTFVYCSIYSLNIYFLGLLFTQDEMLKNFLSLTIILFLSLFSLSIYWLRFSPYSPSLTFNFSELNKEQWMQLMTSMQTRKLSPVQTQQLTTILGQKIEQRIIWNARYLLQEEKHFLTSLKKHCPTLTPGEQKVCFLIFQEMTVSQISSLLNITESTVTSIRSHIRLKLKLSKENNLNEYLHSHFFL